MTSRISFWESFFSPIFTSLWAKLRFQQPANVSHRAVLHSFGLLLIKVVGAKITIIHAAYSSQLNRVCVKSRFVLVTTAVMSIYQDVKFIWIFNNAMDPVRLIMQNWQQPMAMAQNNRNPRCPNLRTQLIDANLTPCSCSVLGMTHAIWNLATLKSNNNDTAARPNVCLRPFRWRFFIFISRLRTAAVVFHPKQEQNGSRVEQKSTGNARCPMEWN